MYSHEERMRAVLLYIQYDHSAESFAMILRMALSIMERGTHSKRSLTGRRRICSYHDG